MFAKDNAAEDVAHRVAVAHVMDIDEEIDTIGVVVRQDTPTEKARVAEDVRIHQSLRTIDVEIKELKKGTVVEAGVNLQNNVDVNTIINGYNRRRRFDILSQDSFFTN